MCILDLNDNPAVLGPDMASPVKWAQLAPSVRYLKHFPSWEYEKKKKDFDKKNKTVFLDLDSTLTLQ